MNWVCRFMLKSVRFCDPIYNIVTVLSHTFVPVITSIIHYKDFLGHISRSASNDYLDGSIAYFRFLAFLCVTIR